MSKILTGLKRLRHVNYEEVIETTINAWSDISSHPRLDQSLRTLYVQIKNGTDITRRGGWDVLAFMYQGLLSETYRKAYATDRSIVTTSPFHFIHIEVDLGSIDLRVPWL